MNMPSIEGHAARPAASQPTPSAGAKLRKVLQQKDCVLVPGAYDCISALAIEQAGFDIAYMTGAGTAASLGYPDIGLLTMTEMTANANRMARAIQIPLICDADTGYGNEINVARTIQEYERAGAAGLHIEDQVFPKRCGHLDGKEVIDRAEYIQKIRAAVHARSNADFLLIARTDAIATHGLDEALTRANLALEAGADMVFVEAPQSLEAIRTIPKEVNGMALLNLVSGGKTPPISYAQATDYGFKIALMPGVLLRNAIHLFDNVLHQLQQDGMLHNLTGQDSVKRNFERFGLSRWLGFQQPR